MSKDMMQVKHTKRGMKKLMKNILLLQLNYVSVGIHNNDNRETSGSIQRRNSLKAMRSLKKLEKKKSYWKDEEPELKIKFDQTEKRSSKERTGKQRCNLATLAYYLEQSVSWIQKKTIMIQGVAGMVTVWKGARIHRPARVFIRIFKLPEIWNKVQSFERTQVKNLFARAMTDGKKFWTALGAMVCSEQKNVIQTSHNAGNSDITMQIKGKNHPLFDTGKLLNSTSYKVRKNYSGKIKEAKLHFLANLDEYMKQLS